VSQKVISVHDKYCVDIYQTQYESYVVSIVIVLQHMIRHDRQVVSSSVSVNTNN